MLSQKRLRELFSYRDGQLYWRVSPSRCVAIGARAGCRRADGYLIVNIDRHQYRVHRLIFALHHGAVPDVVDHVNGIVSDNRVENLRAATNTENSWNRAENKNNSTGFCGVDWHKASKSFRARISVDGTRIELGLFKTAEDASSAYWRAKKQHCGEFIREAA